MEWFLCELAKLKSLSSKTFLTENQQSNTTTVNILECLSNAIIWLKLLKIWIVHVECQCCLVGRCHVWKYLDSGFKNGNIMLPHNQCQDRPWQGPWKREDDIGGLKLKANYWKLKGDPAKEQTTLLTTFQRRAKEKKTLLWRTYMRGALCTFGIRLFPE